MAPAMRPILLGIVRFERIVQLIEEDRQVAVTLAQRGRQHGFSPAFDRRKQLPPPQHLTALTQIKLQDIYSSRSVAEESAEPEDWLASIQPKSSRSRADSVRIRTVSFVMRGLDPRIHDDLPQSKPLRQGRRSVFSAWIAGSSPAMTSGETRFKSNGTCSNCRGIPAAPGKSLLTGNLGGP
jgi:hypothetical protein